MEATAMLNKVLADQFALYVKLRNYHWNVIGPFFNDLHKFFETEYQAIEAMLDETAERVRALGQRPLGSMQEFLSQTSVKEVTGLAFRPSEHMIKDIVADYTMVAANLRQIAVALAESDPVTADMATGQGMLIEKSLWMFRSLGWGTPLDRAASSLSKIAADL